MLEQALRKAYQVILVDRVAEKLQHKTSPNSVTILSGLLGVLVLPAVYFNHAGLAVCLLLLSGYLDTLDGTLARMTHNTSAWGTVLDIVIDRFVEFMVIFALFLYAPERAIWCILMLGSILLCITSFLIVGVFTENDSDKSFHYSPGLMERAEAFAFFIVMMLAPKSFSYLAPIFVLLVTYTALFRLYEFHRKNQ